MNANGSRRDEADRDSIMGVPADVTASLTGFNDPRRAWRRLFAEVLGTFLLVVAAAGAAMVAARFPGTVSPAAEAVAPGLTVLAMILFMGKVSGAHLNPAVTLAFAMRRDFPWRRVPAYVVAQLVGAVLAALVLTVATGVSAAQGATVPGAGITAGQALLVETLLAFGLVSVILGTASGAQNIGVIGAVGVGGYIALAGLWAAPLTGASMNPARTLGPDLVAGEFTSWGVYLVGPLLGALLAVGAAWILRGPGGGVSGSVAAQGTLAPEIAKPLKP